VDPVSGRLSTLAELCRTVDHVDADLTLKGLILVHARNS
jgi:hypothetical protein